MLRHIVLRFAAGLVGMALTLAGVSPEDAKSNISGGLEMTGLPPLNEYIPSAIDPWIVGLGVALIVAALKPSLLLNFWMRSRPEPQERIHTARTAGEIFHSIIKLSDIGVDKYAQPHIGKWIRIQSVIRNMSQDEQFVYVMLGKWFDPMPVLRFARSKWSPALETMDVGDRLAAEGKITKIEHLTMYLDVCEIVDLGGKDDTLRRPSANRKGTTDG